PAGELHGHTDSVFAVGTWTHSKDTTLLVSAGVDRVVRLWHPDTLRPAGELHGHTGPVFAVGTWTHSKDTTLLVSAGVDRVVRLWHPDT
ncbi:hypothetical protein ABZ780_04225, partial [Micromonospora sp. NPDC047467]|uniref:WD40 repeat domain-containing protein n=1 Tax=Micromonospora sp. NPDC047467 TaxID=3154814 RepID=UPI0033EDEE26